MENWKKYFIDLLDTNNITEAKNAQKGEQRMKFNIIKKARNKRGYRETTVGKCHETTKLHTYIRNVKKCG